jgi:hypothetical protein
MLRAQIGYPSGNELKKSRDRFITWDHRSNPTANSSGVAWGVRDY